MNWNNFSIDADATLREHHSSPHHYQLPITNYQLPFKNMENTQTLDLIAGGLALAIVIGAYLMMHTTIFTTKKNK